MANGTLKVSNIQTSSGSGTITLGQSGETIACSGTLGSGMGKVLQIINVTDNTNTVSSSSTYADTGLTASITPSSSSSKVLVSVIHNGCGKSSNDTALQLKLLRGSTDLIQFEKFAGATSTTAQNNFGASGICFLDSPSSTSSVTYKTQLSSYSNNTSAYVNTGTIYSSITLMEIAG